MFTYTTSDGSGPAIPTAACGSIRIRRRRTSRRGSTASVTRGAPKPSSRTTARRAASSAGGCSRGRTGPCSTTNYAYDLDDRVATVTDPLGLVSSSRTTRRQGHEHHEPEERGHVDRVDADRKVTKVTEPTGAFREFAYNANGYLTDEWDQLRNQTHLDYQNVAVDASDVAWQVEHGADDSAHQPVVKVTSPKGMATTAVADDYQTTFTYDAKGNLTQVTGRKASRRRPTPTGSSSSTLEPDGTLASETDPNGSTTTYAVRQPRAGHATDGRARSRHAFGYDRTASCADPGREARRDHRRRRRASTRTQFFYDAFHRMGKQTSPKLYAVSPACSGQRGRLRCQRQRRLQTQPYYSTSRAFPADLRLRRDGPPRRWRRARTRRSTRWRANGAQYDADGRLAKVTGPKGVRDRGAERPRRHTLRRARPRRAGDALRDGRRRHRHERPQHALLLRPRRRHALDDRAEGGSRHGGLRRDHRRHLDPPTRRRTPTTRRTGGSRRRTRSGLRARSRTTRTTTSIPRRTRSATRDEDYDQRDLLIKIVVPVEPGTLGTGSRTATTRTFYDRRQARQGGQPARLGRLTGRGAGQDDFPKFFTRYEYDAAQQMTRVAAPDRPGRSQARSSTTSTAPTTRTATSSGRRCPSRRRRRGRCRTPTRHATPTTTRAGFARSTSRGAEIRSLSSTAPRGWQSKRTAAGKPTETWTYYPDGRARSHTDPKRRRRRTTTTPTTTCRAWTTRAAASGQQTPIDVTATYDWLDRRTKIVQKKQGQSSWLFTTMQYNLNGNVTVREDDGRRTRHGQRHEAPRRNEFTYDEADWVKQQIDRGRDTGCDDDRRITSEFFNTGWLQIQEGQRGNASCGWDLKVDDSKDYFANGRLQKVVTKNGAGGVRESHTLSYVDARASTPTATGRRTTSSVPSLAGRPAPPPRAPSSGSTTPRTGW